MSTRRSLQAVIEPVDSKTWVLSGPFGEYVIRYNEEFLDSPWEVKRKCDDLSLGWFVQFQSALSHAYSFALGFSH